MVRGHFPLTLGGASGLGVLGEEDEEDTRKLKTKSPDIALVGSAVWLRCSQPGRLGKSTCDRQSHPQPVLRPKHKKTKIKWNPVLYRQFKREVCTLMKKEHAIWHCYSFFSREHYQESAGQKKSVTF